MFRKERGEWSFPPGRAVRTTFMADELLLTLGMGEEDNRWPCNSSGLEKG